MKTLFDADRLSLDDALGITEASLLSHAPGHDHWCVAFSGGKDSTATLTAVIHLIEAGRVPRPRRLTALYADTRLELPNLQEAARAALLEVARRGFEARIVFPLLDKRFYVLMLGRGIPPSHSGFRWCTGALKVDPMAEAMRLFGGAGPGKMLLITGMRIGESANRDRRISLACSAKNGGECGQGWYEQSTPAEVADVLSPLLHWRTCHVWDWLMLHGKRHGFDCRLVAEVYDQDAEGSAVEVLARTGCLVCPVASRDYALERTVRKPEWAYLAPLARLRSLYDELSQPRCRLRKVGERRKDGSLSANPNRLGPLLLPAREMGLRFVLDVQAEVNDAARALGRPEISLISAEEEARIRELIGANTWPDKWSGDEPAGNADVPEVYADGSEQRRLFGA